jgi:hypothetical protein
MLHCRGQEKRERKNQTAQCGELERLQVTGQAAESGLEKGTKSEAQEDFSAEHKHSSLVQSVLNFAFESRHAPFLSGLHSGSQQCQPFSVPLAVPNLGLSAGKPWQWPPT